MTAKDLEQIRQIVREEIQAAMKPTAPHGLMTETGSLISTKEFSGEPVADIADPFRLHVDPFRTQTVSSTRNQNGHWNYVTRSYTATLASAEQTESRA